MALSAEKAARKGLNITQEHKDQAADLMGMIVAAELKKSGKGKGKKAKHDQRGKDNGERARDAAPVAEAIVKKVKAEVAADHSLGHQIKELRDGGMAWWQIAYQLELPGSGPNVAEGKSGAARARSLYKKTFGDLPGDVARRSTKASRAAGDGAGAPVVRKPQFNEDQLAAVFDNEGAEAEANAEILAKVEGHEIRWVGRTECSDGTVLEVEREARVYPGSAKIDRAEDKPTVLHFREYSKGDRRAEQWRSVRLADVYDIRR